RSVAVRDVCWRRSGASGEAEPLLGELDPSRAVEEVEQHQHALTRRQAALDHRGETAEGATGDGDGAAGADGVDLDHAVGARAGAQVCDDLGCDACRRIAERDETQRAAVVGDPALVDRVGLAEDIARKHGADLCAHRRARPLAQERKIARHALAHEDGLDRAFLVALGLEHKPAVIGGESSAVRARIVSSRHLPLDEINPPPPRGAVSLSLYTYSATRYRRRKTGTGLRTWFRTTPSTVLPARSICSRARARACPRVEPALATR